MSKENKNWLVETSKKIDMAGLAIGGAVYLAAGVPWALTLFALSGGTLLLTIGGERVYNSWKGKMKGSAA